MDDARLIAETLRGNVAAFEQLVTAYQRIIVASAYQMVRQQADAEDLAQETLLEAYRDLAKLREPARFRAWLFSILRHNCYRYLQQRRPEELPLDDVAETLAAPTPFSDDLALAECLAQLPLAQRELLLARYLYELSYREIAHELHITEMAARMRCARARGQLRVIVEQNREEENALRQAMAGLAVGVSADFTRRVLSEVRLSPPIAPVTPPTPPLAAHWAAWHTVAHVATWKVVAALLGLALLGGSVVLLQPHSRPAPLPPVMASTTAPLIRQGVVRQVLPRAVAVAPSVVVKPQVSPVNAGGGASVLPHPRVTLPGKAVTPSAPIPVVTPMSPPQAPSAATLPASLPPEFTSSRFAEIIDEKALLLDWFTLPVTTSAGTFNPVFIPFQSQAHGVPADANQSLTFPMLLHFKFSFVSDNYSNRAPAFIYRKDPRARRLGVTDAHAIADYIRRWSATHAIGGSITATKGGYTGELLVFDAGGARILRQRYRTPLPYFTLMGRMVEDWMAYRRQPCAPALQAELVRPMTSNMQTVTWYGTSFGKPWRTPEEWAVYQRILAADPGFGEVRYWYAYQRSWVDGFNAARLSEIARAFLDRPIPDALCEYEPRQITDEPLRERADAAFERALAMMPEHGKLQYLKYFAYGWDGKKYQDMEALLPLAQRYPGAWQFSHTLAHYFNGAMMLDKGIPLALSAAQSGWLCSDESGMWNDYMLAASAYWQTGHGNAAWYCLQGALRQATTADERIFAYDAMINLQRDYLAPADASKLARAVAPQVHQATKLRDDTGKQEFLVDGYLAADEAGQQENAAALGGELIGLPARYSGLCRLRRAVSRGEYAVEKTFTLPDSFQHDRYDHPRCYLNTDREQALLQVGALPAELPEAAQAARRVWAHSPLVPRSGELLARVWLRQHPQELLRYAEAAHWLAPEEPYWPELQQRALDAGAKEDSNAEITALLIEWKDKAARVPDDTSYPSPCSDFWNTIPPFLPEYLVMQALASRDHAQIAAAMPLFVHYCHAQYLGMVFDLAHLHVSSLKILHLLPADLAAQYKQSLGGGNIIVLSVPIRASVAR